ncbi:hypothetical protein LFX25_20585 [Leptospira sp. FAT2]|uniref:hypothetical protein n=1 Tax=Leptospira sanjuanensis TaxID=2879643 RepID=UPI001EE9ACFB|nr:hypothetical protein [Leptospira sanjuanensis]MCG6195643.1 hypothetical protein [Leptospira sanjuanensis]
MGLVLNYFVKGIAKVIFFEKLFNPIKEIIKAIVCFIRVNYAFSDTRLRLMHLRIFVAYHYQMLKLAYSTWKSKFKIHAVAPAQIMVLHYDPYTCRNPEELATKVARNVAIPFKTLYKFEPIILILPNDQILQTGSIQGFLRSLSRDQLKTFFEEYAKFREDQKRIEIIGS